MKADTRLLLVGCGKMGGALLQRIAGKLTAVIVDPAEAPAELKSLPQTKWLSSLDALDAGFKPDVVLLAVKPQQMPTVLPAYGRFKDSAFLSIAAGVPIAAMEKFLGGSFAVVRTMPNLPAKIGQGMTVAVANSRVTAEQKHLCDDIMRAVGETAWVEDEALIDAVTALSGNGPAYIFALCEALEKAGEELGLSKTLSMKLARQTVVGSSALLAQSHEAPDVMRKAVTSPGGTTEAALKEIMANGNGLYELMLKGMKAAVARARELAKLA
ncbi:MAG TPA: pyrroline-5-carboxylate reductase [Alphaproteobacteria bacterium]|nr:pyrroline-5-carboxylate reductase [Alphaproteobacteria bacterium]